MWEPISEGARASRVWDRLDAIADVLAECTAPAADLAVFWTYLASERDDARTIGRAERAVEQFVAELERGYARPALFEGLAGAGWAAMHVASDAQELLDVIDARLLGLLEPGTWTGTFDLISGVAGFGAYFLERDGAAAERGRRLVVDHFAASVTRDADGATWRTPVELLEEPDRPHWPHGVHDCGVAHGVAGVIGVLARIAARDDSRVARELAADATRWLFARRLHGQLPSRIAGEQRMPSRTAWCYGAPGICLALGGREDLADWLGLPPSAIEIDDSWLCHGAACLLHLANRMYQATKVPQHRDTALAWLDRLLGMPVSPERRAAILTGHTGVGLALLAAVSETEPEWDRILLTDVRVR